MSNSLKKNVVKVMVFGSFDGLHRGHLDFFRQARALIERKKLRNSFAKPFLIVSVARDKNVIKIKHKKPFFNERKRMILIKKCNLVDEVVLSGVGNHIPHILKERPDIIALGYDQSAYVPNLKKDLKNKGLLVKIVRLKPYKEKIYKNHLLKKKKTNTLI